MGQQEQGGRMVCQEMPHRVSRKPDGDGSPSLKYENVVN